MGDGTTVDDAMTADDVTTPDNVTTADGGNLTSLDQENPALQTAVTVASLKSLHGLNDLAWAIQISDRSIEACDGGGTKVFTSRTNGGCARCQVIVDVDLNNCGFDGQTIDGRITLVPLTGCRDRRYSSVTYTNQAGETIGINGKYSAFPLNTEYENSFSHIWTVDTLNYVRDDSIEVTDLSSEYTTTSSTDSLKRDLVQYRASFEFVGVATENIGYKFTTIDELVSAPENTYFDAGIIRIQSDFDTALDVNFGTGDPRTLMLILQKESGAEDSSQDVAESMDRLYFSISNQI